MVPFHTELTRRIRTSINRKKPTQSLLISLETCVSDHVTTSGSHIILNEWQISTGSSCHVTNSKFWFKAGTYRERRLGEVHTGNGTAIYEGIGTVDLKTVLPGGSTHTIRLNNVLYIPDYRTNIFSATLLYKDGYGCLAYDKVDRSDEGYSVWLVHMPSWTWDFGHVGADVGGW